MCDKLFPMAVHWQFWVSDDGSEDHIGYNSHATLGVDKDFIPAVDIHWFEFCMMKLAPKIMPPFIECEEFYSGLLGLNEVSSYQKHPVDYLYEQFKKLKQ